MTDVLADWKALDAARRDEVTAAIVARVVADRLASHPHFGDSERPSRLDVYAASSEGDRVTVHFVFDHYLYCRTISGSDWAEHRIYVGRATHERGREVQVEILEDRSVHLTENEADPYDCDSAVSRIRDEKVRAMPDVVRCPRCGSTDAVVADVIFEVTRIECNACGQASSDDGEPPAPAPAPAPPPSYQPPARIQIVPSKRAVLECPYCGSTDVRDASGRSSSHFTYLECRRCGRGEEIDSLTAAGRWRR